MGEYGLGTGAVAGVEDTLSQPLHQPVSNYTASHIIIPIQKYDALSYWIAY